MSSPQASEAAALRAHGLAVFGGRLITRAQPPITPVQRASIEARCAGPLPPELVALWSTAFGGRLDYDLRVRFDDDVVSCSFRELFYPGSDGYRDLWEWMDHEAELGDLERLGFLPIGGFEHLERVYVQTTPGPDYGSVHAWIQGLPPPWRLRLHRDAATQVAPDLLSFFGLLVLDEDPFVQGPRYRSGQDALAAIAPLEAEAGTEALVERLHALLRGSVVRR